MYSLAFTGFTLLPYLIGAVVLTASGAVTIYKTRKK